MMWAYIGIVILLIMMAGFMSGLTVGLASIDKLDLEIKMAIGTESEKKSAVVIGKVTYNHHWMLCTLLLCNATAMEALPLFLDRLLSPIAAVLLSVTCVLIFGEVVPQAFCTGPS
jgi:metal transporter CNNM